MQHLPVLCRHLSVSLSRFLLCWLSSGYFTKSYLKKKKRERTKETFFPSHFFLFFFNSHRAACSRSIKNRHNLLIQYYTWALLDVITGLEKVRCKGRVIPLLIIYLFWRTCGPDQDLVMMGSILPMCDWKNSPSTPPSGIKYPVCTWHESSRNLAGWHQRAHCRFVWTRSTKF